ncbi:Hsp20/alpha crystallin family protein [bacterium]|nr:Hsp20/alpha crystallin family protein [bacterium]MBU1958161.1 Hsp20/alpha crystallin family protein [bacterium]
MLVTRYRPRDSFNDFRRSFDLFNSMLSNIETAQSVEDKYGFTPAVNTREGEYAYHVEVDLPGVKKEDIKVGIEENKIVISGEKKLKEELKEENYYKVESFYGEFKRSFTLPEGVDVENIHAESKDGVLEVTIPKLEKSEVEKIKRIKIN